MLRLAARMRSRPGMRMSAVSRRLRMHGMRFATHGSLAGMPGGEAPLSYLASARPLQLQYHLNWQGRIQVLRNLSALLVERVVHTRMLDRVERLLGRLLPVLRPRHGGSPPASAVIDRPRARRDSRPTTVLQRLRTVAMPAAAGMPPGRADRGGPVIERSRRSGQTWRRAAWPTISFGRALPVPHAGGDASRILLRHAWETLRLFGTNVPEEGAGAAAHSVPGAAGTLDSAMQVRHPLTSMIFARYAAVSPRLFSAVRGGETLLRWLRTSHSSHSSHSSHVSRERVSASTAWVRQLHARMATVVQHVWRSLPASAGRDRPSSLSRARMALRAATPTLRGHRAASRDGRRSNAMQGWILPTQPVIGSPPPLLALFRIARTPGERMRTGLDLFVSRLSHVFRQATRWRPQAGGAMRGPSSAAPAAAPEAAGIPWLLLQRVEKGSGSVLRRAMGLARKDSPSGLRRLALAPPQVSRYEHRSTVSLLRSYAPALATTYGRGQPSPAVMSYREAPRPPELQWSKQVQRIEQQITRNIVQNITQAMPWRGDMEKAVLTPRVMRELAEQVGGMMTQRIGLERYRRGL